MPTTSGPMPPPNPYTGGCNNPVSNKETKASQILEIAISAIVILIVLAILCTPQKNYQTIEDLSEMNEQRNQGKESCDPDTKDIKSKKFKKINFYDTLILMPEIFINSKVLSITTSIALPALFYTSDNLAYKLIYSCLLLAIVAAYIRYIYQDFILRIVSKIKKFIKNAPSSIRKFFRYIKSEILTPLFFFPLPAVFLVLLSGALSSLLTGNNPLIAASDPFLYTTLLMPALAYFTLGLLVANKKNVEIQDSPPDQETSPENENKPFNEQLILILKTQAKLLTSLFPASIVVSFIFVLYHNQELTNGDIGSALEITSAQFPEKKIKWATITLLYFLFLYFSFASALFIKTIKDSLDKDFPRIARERLYVNYLVSLAIAFFLATISNLINIHVIKLIATENVEIILFLTTALSFTVYVFPIRQIITDSIPSNPKPAKKSKANSISITMYYIIFMLSIIVSFSTVSKMFFEYLPKSIGGVVANPGATLESEESDYACIFSNDNKSKESITLGVVVESKPESIRIFTPEYNRNDNEYGKRIGGGKIKLNKLVETQIKISGGYRIEKFDGSKHGYNHQTGKCEYVQTRYSLKEIFYKEYIENSKNPPHK